jgi:hypothetical protein
MPKGAAPCCSGSCSLWAGAPGTSELSLLDRGRSGLAARAAVPSSACAKLSRLSAKLWNASAAFAGLLLAPASPAGASFTPCCASPSLCGPGCAGASSPRLLTFGAAVLGSAGGVTEASMAAACWLGGLGPGSGSLAASVVPSSDVFGGLHGASAADVSRTAAGACWEVGATPVSSCPEKLGPGPSAGCSCCGRLRVNCTGGGGSGGGAGSDPVHEDVLLLLPLNVGGRARALLPAAPAGRPQGMAAPLSAPSPAAGSLLNGASAVLALDVLACDGWEGRAASG